MPKVIDTHAHLNFPAYDADRGDVVSRMQAAGIGAINVGTTVETSQSAVLLAEQYEDMWASVGIHPGHAGADRFHDESELRKKPEGPEVFDRAIFHGLIAHPKVVAIGECGLDYHYPNHDKAAQKELFQSHINLALDAKKPLIIHCRDAYDDLLNIIKPHGGELSGTVHFFTGTLDYAQKFIDLGFYISFSGVITFVKEYETTVREVPLERILIETDCPYATPAPHRGKRNEPAYVIEIARKIAELTDEPLGRIIEQTTANARHLFNLS